METVHTGGRPLTRAALAGRRRALDEGRAISRRELASAGREAARALRLRPALRAILSALCAVWGEQPWDRLIVWPSNAHLSAMTGLSERALRYGLADLVRLELVTPRDSANGKRFAVRGAGGEIVDAYGLDLTPVAARRGEWEAMIRAAAEAEEAKGRAFDAVTRDRRAVDEALAALDRYPDARSTDLEAARQALLHDTPKRRSAAGMSAETIDAWSELRAIAEERFYQAASAGNSSRHSEQDTCSSTNACTRAPREEPGPTGRLDPALVAAACPVATEMGATLANEADVIDLGRSLRGSIGAHPSAWTEACEAIGAARAAVLVLIVAQIHDDDVRTGESRIKNPGGYFRRLVRLAAEGRYGIEAEMMAMRRRKMT